MPTPLIPPLIHMNQRVTIEMKAWEWIALVTLIGQVHHADYGVITRFQDSVSEVFSGKVSS